MYYMKEQKMRYPKKSKQISKDLQLKIKHI